MGPAAVARAWADSVKRSWLPRLVCLAVAVGCGSVFFIQYCDLLFDCGCRALWAGAADHCNVHNPSPPHCPWCAGDGLHGAWSFRWAVAAQAALAFGPGRFGWLRAAMVFAAFAVVGAIGAAGAGLATGYWG